MLCMHGIINLFSALVEATNLRAASHRVGWCGLLAHYVGTHQRGRVYVLGEGLFPPDLRNGSSGLIPNE